MESAVITGWPSLKRARILASGSQPRDSRGIGSWGCTDHACGMMKTVRIEREVVVPGTQWMAQKSGSRISRHGQAPSRR